jgi:hypothetical protein
LLHYTTDEDIHDPANRAGDMWYQERQATVDRSVYGETEWAYVLRIQIMEDAEYMLQKYGYQVPKSEMATLENQLLGEFASRVK